MHSIFVGVTFQSVLTISPRTDPKIFLGYFSSCCPWTRNLKKSRPTLALFAASSAFDLERKDSFFFCLSLTLCFSFVKSFSSNLRASVRKWKNSLPKMECVYVEIVECRYKNSFLFSRVPIVFKLHLNWNSMLVVKLDRPWFCESMTFLFRSK